jgi:hypothetical protein
MGVAAACTFLACAFAPAGLADGLKPDPSPGTGGLGPDSATTPAPAPTQKAPTRPAVRATPPTIVRSTPAPAPTIVTRTVVVPVPAAPAPARPAATKPKPAQPKRAAKPAPKPKPKPHVSKPHRVLPFGVRVAVAGANTTVNAASLALPAAFAFVALVGASGGFLAFVYRLRRELAQV